MFDDSYGSYPSASRQAAGALARPEQSDLITGCTGERFGQWVQGEMCSRGWTQARLAVESGLPPSTLSDIVRGAEPGPTVDELIGLARAFRITPDDVLVALDLWAPDSQPHRGATSFVRA